ncbi:hypothetical protein ACT3RN_10080 [Psychrobacter sp. AOP5-GZ1-6]|uniref:hypothetical protein n=1 Tax=unclassified Psychrobacter TaxID=196806 RepID=UPI00402BCD0B
MKTVELSLNDSQENSLFRPIRNKIDYARVVLLSSRYILINTKKAVPCKPTLKLKFDKSMRLFFYSRDKFFSVAYPFLVSIQDEKVVVIRTLNGNNLDSYAISSALAILQDDNFIRSLSLTEFYIGWNKVDSSDLDIDIDLGIAILETIFQFEPSYIRYDYDEKHETGKKHPLNHFDICYSSHGTFKIGLEKRIDSTFFEDILDLSTDCIYIK